MRLALLLISLVALTLGKKYRSDKINYIYDKALQHIQDRQHLARLEKELTGYDGIFMHTKDLYSHGKVENLNKEMIKIDKKLIEVLQKYGLEKTVLAFREKMKNKNSWEYKEENSPTPSDKFTNDKIQKLWHQAQAGQFSENELLELHEELKVAERKMEDYEDHLANFARGPHENALDFDEIMVKEKRKKVKMAHQAAEDHFQKLHKKITSEEYSPFKEDKVRRLWKLAQANANFSLHDYEILKDELLHFDNQLRKIDFHKTELESLRGIREKEGKQTLHNVEEAELGARHEKLVRKMRKIEKYLESKIIHSEL